MSVLETKLTSAFENLREKFSWSNVMQTPRIVKVVVSVGTGRTRKDKQKIEVIQDRLIKITGQKSSPRKARKSIASFKLREGETIGYMVTLRGAKMRSFLDRFLNIAIPRMRDFQGIPLSSVDEAGNLTIGVAEHTIFPETPDENLQDIFGLSVTIVTSTNNREEATEYLKHIGIPFLLQ